MHNIISTGSLGPLQPKSSKATTILLIAACCVFATTQGYDSAVMNGINIMLQYTAWFKLTTATTSLNTCASFIGWGLAAPLMGPAVEAVGRNGGVIMSVILKLIGILLMTSAQDPVMFLIGRIVLGWGTGTAAIGASTWLAETLPPSIRGLGLSIIYSVYYVGALLAAGVCYGTQQMSSSWSWRLPCALEAVFSIGCAFILRFTPESPRWLAYHGKESESLAVLASDVSIVSGPGSGDVKVLDGVEEDDQDNAIGKEGIFTVVKDQGKSE